MELENVAQVFTTAKQGFDEARSIIVSRIAAIKVEKKENNARLSAEAKELRALLGRTRVARLGAIKTRKPRASKPKPAEASA